MFSSSKNLSSATITLWITKPSLSRSITVKSLSLIFYLRRFLVQTAIFCMLSSFSQMSLASLPHTNNHILWWFGLSSVVFLTAAGRGHSWQQCQSSMEQSPPTFLKLHKPKPSSKLCSATLSRAFHLLIIFARLTLLYITHLTVL